MSANVNKIMEYKSRFVKHQVKFDALNKVLSKMRDIKLKIDDFRTRRFDMFMSGFNTISAKLKETY